MQRRSEIPGITGDAVGISGEGKVIVYDRGQEEERTQTDAENLARKLGKPEGSINIYGDTTDRIRGPEVTEDMMHRNQ